MAGGSETTSDTTLENRLTAMLWGWWVASFYRRCKHFNVTNLTITPFKLAHELGEINIYTGKQERFQLFRGFSIHKKWSNRSTMPPMLQCFIAFLQCFSAFLGFLVHHPFYGETKTNMGRGSSSSGITIYIWHILRYRAHFSPACKKSVFFEITWKQPLKAYINSKCIYFAYQLTYLTF